MWLTDSSLRVKEDKSRETLSTSFKDGWCHLKEDRCFTMLNSLEILCSYNWWFYMKLHVWKLLKVLWKQAACHLFSTSDAVQFWAFFFKIVLLFRDRVPCCNLGCLWTVNNTFSSLSELGLEAEAISPNCNPHSYGKYTVVQIHYHFH